MLLDDKKCSTQRIVIVLTIGSSEICNVREQENSSLSLWIMTIERLRRIAANTNHKETIKLNAQLIIQRCYTLLSSFLELKDLLACTAPPTDFTEIVLGASWEVLRELLYKFWFDCSGPLSVARCTIHFVVSKRSAMQLIGTRRRLVESCCVT